MTFYMKEDNIQIRINSDTKEKFKELCEKEGLTMSSKIHNMIKIYLMNNDEKK